MDKPFSQDRIGYVANLINPRKEMKVLNIGVSNIPEIELEIEDKVKECWTLDLDKAKVQDASAKTKKTTYVVGDVTESNLFKKNYFDVIVVLEVLEHLEDDDAAVKILKGYLKKGGIIIASVPNRNLLHAVNPVMYTQHKRHYSNYMFQDLFARNGFTIQHFNIVESWRLLGNLYIHLFSKYLFGKKRNFNFFNKEGDKTYGQMNSKGLDLVIVARKN